VVVGHDLESCTRGVEPFEAPIPQDYASSLAGCRLILVDTPGFDQEFLDDSEIFSRILAWLERMWVLAPSHSNTLILITCRNEKGTSLAGIVYMSNIAQEQMTPPWSTVGKLLSMLCGGRSLSKVVLATMQWDRLQGEHPTSRGQERAEVMCQPLASRGAKVMHIKHKPDDQAAIIAHLLKLVERGSASDATGGALRKPKPRNKTSGNQNVRFRLRRWFFPWRPRPDPKQSFQSVSPS
jgi:hypothetical protein